MFSSPWVLSVAPCCLHICARSTYGTFFFHTADAAALLLLLLMGARLLGCCRQADRDLQVSEIGPLSDRVHLPTLQSRGGLWWNHAELLLRIVTAEMSRSLKRPNDAEASPATDTGLLASSTRTYGVVLRLVGVSRLRCLS